MKSAVSADKRLDYASAYGLYRDALEYLLSAYSYEIEPRRREPIRAAIDKYIVRAEVGHDNDKLLPIDCLRISEFTTSNQQREEACSLAA